MRFPQLCLFFYFPVLSFDVTWPSGQTSSQTRALLRLERTMHLLEGGKGGEGRMGERVWGGDGGRVGEREGGEGRMGRESGEGGRGGEGRGRGGEGGRGGREGGKGRGGGGMTVIIHILIGMFNSNPMIPQYLNNNLT